MFPQLIFDLNGTALEQEERELLTHPFCAGIILFARNIENSAQLMALIRQIRAVNQDILITVDQEGGRVQRIRCGVSELPALKYFGDCYDADKQEQLSATPCNTTDNTEVVKENVTAFSGGEKLTKELRAFDIDLSFAPVVDLGDMRSKIIADRAFHQDPDIVAELAISFIKGMRQGGMLEVAKHFPGHGSVIEDSHLCMPVDHRGLDDLIDNDIIPYRKLIDFGLSAVMSAHILYPQLDEDNIATFSGSIITELLRQQLKFTGVVFSDDLIMSGTDGYGDIVSKATLAIRAGCDFLLVCNNRQEVLKLIEGFDISEVAPLLESSNKRCNDFKSKLKVVQSRVTD